MGWSSILIEAVSTTRCEDQSRGKRFRKSSDLACEIEEGFSSQIAILLTSSNGTAPS